MRSGSPTTWRPPATWCRTRSCASASSRRTWWKATCVQRRLLFPGGRIIVVVQTVAEARGNVRSGAGGTAKKHYGTSRTPRPDPRRDRSDCGHAAEFFIHIHGQQLQLIESRLEFAGDDQEAGVVRVEIGAIAATESRLEAMIQADMVKLEPSSKRLLDVLRITARNGFYQALQPFKKSYDNYRDDYGQFGSHR